MTSILSYATRLHRAFFVAGTALLAVAASLLAQDVDEPGHWLIALGSALVMLVSDVLREVEEMGKGLAELSRKSLKQTRADMLETRRQGWLLAGMLLGGCCVATGFAIG